MTDQQSRIRDRDIEIYINSEIDKRINDTPAEWTTLFPQNIPLKGQRYRLMLQGACVPNTMPQFNTDQRQFSFQIEGDINPTVVTIDKSRVFSSTSDLTNFIQTTLNAAGATTVVSLDASTRTINILNNGTGYIDFATTDYMPFWTKLGFETSQESSPGVLRVASGASLLANRLAVLIATQRVYITCSEILNNSFIGSTTTNPPILCVIDMEGAFGTFNTFENNNPEYFNHDMTITNNLNFLSFSLLDDRYKPVELLGSGVRLSLLVKES